MDDEDIVKQMSDTLQYEIDRTIIEQMHDMIAAATRREVEERKAASDAVGLGHEETNVVLI